MKVRLALECGDRVRCHNLTEKIHAQADVTMGSESLPHVVVQFRTPISRNNDHRAFTVEELRDQDVIIQEIWLHDREMWMPVLHVRQDIPFLFDYLMPDPRWFSMPQELPEPPWIPWIPTDE